MTDDEILLSYARSGRPIPPPHSIKQLNVRHYAKRFNIHNLIETGTYYGEMVWAMKDYFEKIISIELGELLYRDAVNQFSAYPHISILHGDSGKVLPHVLSTITEPCLFWLDGHYSAGVTAKGELNTPIMEELHCILTHPIKGHVILIDDARAFCGGNDYPTIGELQKYVSSYWSNAIFEVKDDIMRVHKI